MLPFGQQAFAFRLSAGKGAYFYSLFSYVTALYLCSVSFDIWSVPALFLFCFALYLFFFCSVFSPFPVCYCAAFRFQSVNRAVE